MGLDQDTKTRIKDNFDQIKPQLRTLDQNMSDQDLNKAKTDPDKFVQQVSDSTGQDKQAVERQVKQYANA